MPQGVLRSLPDFVMNFLDQKKVPRTGLQPSETGIPPLWILRALAEDSPTTEMNESIRSGSGHFGGKEILFPTIRFKNGRLEKLDNEIFGPSGFTEAMEEALRQGDFLTFDTPENATAFSKSLSNELGRKKRKPNVFIRKGK